MKRKSESELDIKGLIIIIIVLVVLVGLVYLLTVGAQKLGWFNEHYTKPEVQEAVISYENINAGTIFDRSDNEYYVAIADFSDKNNIYLDSLISKYKEKEDSLPVYVVDLSDGLNSSIKSEENNTFATKVSELKVKDNTLIKITNGNNAGYLVGDESIKSELGL